ncbi:MAG: threonyl-tRNA synthetase editing domain-containing protein [Desulfobacterales bacterium]|jgi:hypothetical protein
MRVLFWFCHRFNWQPAQQTLPDAADAESARYTNCVAAFVHVEPGDVLAGSGTETKLVKTAKWLARKWDVTTVILHSFTHLGDEKAAPDEAQALLLRAGARLTKAGYQSVHTPYGYFLDLDIQAPGHPLARVYKAFP